jgi:trehalose 6-phosphate phosphatase
VVTDFDGTLAPIVEDPAAARPLPGAVEVLGRLAERFGVVAVVSGRPASFLAEHLSPPPGGAGPGASRVRMVGVYGLEWRGEDGEITLEPAADRWRPVVEAVVGRLRGAAPRGVTVEPKGLGVTVHWRRAPGEEAWVVASVAAESERTGLVAHPGRMSCELRPDLGIDKGSTIRRLVVGCSAACYLGDDLGDLPAFAALADLAASGAIATASVAVVDAETDPVVPEAADLEVPGPAAALALLRWLADAPSGTGEV